jgi:hypothetical protein
MYAMKGSQVNLTPKDFMDRFYRNEFDVHGLRFEKAYGSVAVSLKFTSACYYPSEDEPVFNAIGLHSGTNENNSDCNIIIYTGDIQSIQQRYRVYQDKERNVVHRNYDYIFALSDGKELKFECHQVIDA